MNLVNSTLLLVSCLFYLQLRTVKQMNGTVSLTLRPFDLQVLTVNQVYEVLLKFWGTKDWSQALQEAIPDRKKAEMQEEGRKKVGSHVEDGKRAGSQEEGRRKTARPAEGAANGVEEESKRQKAVV